MSTRTPKRAGLRQYRKSEAPPIYETDMMSMPVVEPAAPEQFLEWASSGGQVVKVLYRDDSSGMSLLWAWFGPNYVLPRHSHDSDCLYFIHRGEIRAGNTVLSEGDGFFVPADAPYSYRAGPDGVEVLEFRGATSFNMRITESLARWDQVVEAARANRDRWAAEATRYA